MSDENSQMGTLSVDDAMGLLVKGRESESEGDTPDEDDQAAPDADADEETDSEGEEATDDDDTPDEPEGDDEDKPEDIDADELERGYLRQADYTRKAQEVARDRKALAAEREEFQAQAQQQLATLQKALEAYSIPTEAEPDWANLAETLDPKAYQKKRAEWDKRQQRMAEAKTLHEQITQQNVEAVRAQEAERLFERIPEWRDPATLQRDTTEIVGVAAEYGISADEVQSIMDHRQLALLLDLAKSRRAAKAVQQKRATPRRAIPAAKAPAKSDDGKKAVQNLSARLQRSGSVDDAQALLLARGQT